MQTNNHPKRALRAAHPALGLRKGYARLRERTLAGLILVSAWAGGVSIAQGATYRLAAQGAALEEELAGRLATRRSDPGDKAQINLRVILHHLYRQAQSNDATPTQALLADRADLIRRSLDPVDAQLQQADLWAKRWRRSSAEQRSRPPISTLGTKLDAIATVNELAESLAEKPISTPQRLSEVTTALGKAIVVLADAQTQSGRPWAFSIPRGGSTSGTNPVDLDALNERVVRSRLPLALREHMSQAIAELDRRTKDGNPDRVFATLLDRSSRSLDAAMRLGFLSDENRAFLGREATTALRFFGHPTLRPVGTKRLNDIVQAADALAQLEPLAVGADLKQAVANRIIMAARARKSPAQRAAADETIATISQCARIAHRLNAVHEKADPRRPYAGPFNRARSRYAEHVTAMIGALGDGDLASARNLLEPLRELDGDLVLLAEVPEVAWRLRQLHPPTPGLIDRHVSRQCADLAEGGESRKAALTYLSRLRDIDRSLRDAHRWRLDGLPAQVRVAIVGEGTDAVQASLRSVRRRIAEAYIRPPGATPQLAQQLRDLADYLRAVHTLAAIGEPNALQILNRDRAIELGEAYAGKLLQSQRDTVRAAAKAMAADPRSEGVAGIGRIRRLDPVAEMLATLYTTARSDLGPLPDGLGALAGQLRAAGGRSAGVDDALRRTCLHLNEAGYDLQGGLEFAGDLRLAEAAFRTIRIPPAGSR